MTFICDGKECLDCPLKDCVRALCEVDGELIQVRVVKEPQTKQQYWQNYYTKNRNKILAKKKREREAKKSR